MRRRAVALLCLPLVAGCSVLSDLGSTTCTAVDQQSLTPSASGLDTKIYGIPVTLTPPQISPAAVSSAANALRSLADQSYADCRTARTADASTMQGQVFAAQSQATRAQLLTLAAQLGAATNDTEVARAVTTALRAHEAAAAQRAATPRHAAETRAPAMAATSPTTAAESDHDSLLSAGKSRYPSGFTPAFGAGF
jgi:hypothetical protein